MFSEQHHKEGWKDVKIGEGHWIKMKKACFMSWFDTGLYHHEPMTFFQFIHYYSEIPLAVALWRTNHWTGSFFFLNSDTKHRISVYKNVVALALKLARILPERLRKTSCNWKAQFMFLNILELIAKNTNVNKR